MVRGLRVTVIRGFLSSRLKASSVQGSRLRVILAQGVRLKAYSVPGLRLKVLTLVQFGFKGSGSRLRQFKALGHAGSRSHSLLRVLSSLDP